MYVRAFEYLCVVSTLVPMMDLVEWDLYNEALNITVPYEYYGTSVVKCQLPPPLLLQQL